MTVLNYFKQQKRKIEERHLCEIFLCVSGEEPIGLTFEEEQPAVRARSAREILNEIDGLRGLNVTEREHARTFCNCV